ncbi:hypothetical protein [Oceanobacillus jeddahense]|nr:hypothetical protein [Oceanobacillus jeddahense]
MDFKILEAVFEPFMDREMKVEKENQNDMLFYHGEASVKLPPQNKA